MNFETIPDEDDGADAAATTTDAIELLTADHEDVMMLFADYEELVSDSASAEERRHLVRQICSALNAHTTAEEDIFYPAARAAIGQPALLDQAEAEHSSAKALIAQLLRMDPADAQYDATVVQLQDAIEQHVHEEGANSSPSFRTATSICKRLASGSPIGWMRCWPS